MVKTKKTNNTQKKGNAPQQQQQQHQKQPQSQKNGTSSQKHQKKQTGGTTKSKEREKNVDKSHSKTPEPSFSEPSEFPLCGCCLNSQRIIDSVLDAMKIQGTAQQENFYLTLKELRALIFEMSECCYPPFYGSRRSHSRGSSHDDESSSSTGKFYGDLRDQKNHFVAPPFNVQLGNTNNNNNNNVPIIEAVLPKQ